MLDDYLSKDKKAVSAGKYNPGQKMYFWLSTDGGVISEPASPFINQPVLPS